MEVLEERSSNNRVRVGADAELLEEVVDVGAKLLLTTLIQKYKDRSTTLDVLLERIKLVLAEEVLGASDDEKSDSVKSVKVNFILVNRAL